MYGFFLVNENYFHIPSATRNLWASNTKIVDEQHTYRPELLLTICTSPERVGDHSGHGHRPSRSVVGHIRGALHSRGRYVLRTTYTLLETSLPVPHCGIGYYGTKGGGTRGCVYRVPHPMSLYCCRGARVRCNGTRCRNRTRQS